MADEYSFDIVAKVDLAEVQNAHQSAIKQIANRYDFRGKLAKLEFDKGEKRVVADGSDDYIVDQMMDIFSTLLAKRGIDLKALEEKTKEAAPSGGIRKTFSLRDSLTSEQCKQITKAVKESKLKVRASIHGDAVRITGKSKDDLQAAQQMARGIGLEAPITFTNYK